MGHGANLVYFDEARGQLNVAYQQPPSRGDPHRLGDRDPAVEPHVGLLIQRKDRTPSVHLRFPHLNTARTIVVPRLVTVGGSRSAFTA